MKNKLILVCIIICGLLTSCKSLESFVTENLKDYKHEEMLDISEKYRINRKVEIPEKVVSMSTGTTESIFAITESGNVYCWGNNQYGQLGLGHENEVTEAVLNPYLKNIVQVAASVEYTLALDENGQVFGFGTNDYCRINNGDKKYLIPAKIESLPEIEQIASTRNFSVALGVEGKTYFWGLKGSREKNDLQKTPLPMETDVPIKHISAGLYHISMIDTNSYTWGMGDNGTGGLGIGSIEDSFEFPVKTKQKALMVIADYLGTVALFDQQIYTSGSMDCTNRLDKTIRVTKKFEKSQYRGVYGVNSIKVHLQNAVLETLDGRLIFHGYERMIGSLVDRTQKDV